MKEVTLTFLSLFISRFCASFTNYEPRLTLHQDSEDRVRYNGTHNTVLFHEEGSDDIYIGAKHLVLRISLEKKLIMQYFSLCPRDGQNWNEISCSYMTTVIQQFEDSLFLCGTDGHTPQCWKLYPPAENQTSAISAGFSGRGISPYFVSQNLLTLAADGDLYAAAPLYSDGSLLQFRRNRGKRKNTWMYEKWVLEPTFISAAWIKRKDDPENEKIYIFFREKNSDSNPEADPWISRIAQVCKVDEGGPKRFFQNTWTSFLKARLMCGIPEESLYFNRLQDVFVQEADDWRDRRVFVLFTSSWNSSAVCIYSLSDIARVFQNSSFKDFHENIPNPRPGMCVADSRKLPGETLSVVKDHAEMDDWIQPMNKQRPFYISSLNYTKIAVDRVMGTNRELYNVLFLATENRIHKVLEHNSKPFIISETLLPNRMGHIQTIQLDSKKRKLLVGLPDELALVDLQSCQNYNQSCEDCVLARDPYCAWAEAGCRPVDNTEWGGIQDVAGGITEICKGKGSKTRRKKRDTPEMLSCDVPQTTYSVLLDLPFYLSCPIHSHHATYVWEHSNQSSKCQQDQSTCLHLITAVKEDSYGTYECYSEERDYTQCVKAYKLVPKLDNTATSISAQGAAMAFTVSLISALCL
ncbi:semaphorin-7A isoform X1 [Paramormyrops kingsleyae]|uniref:semaphorin-7A isoform X1 n=1 Tax=Paramormyrops kingsleyae TaxID=1676925 RepID=UPI003B96CFFB